MFNKEFEIEINAKADHVWFVLWDSYHYRDWTSVFHSGSYAKSDWNEGSKIHFLTPEGNGMYSIIDKKIINTKMVFRHIGNIKNFEEKTIDEETKQWTGSTETYTLVETDGKTKLVVSLYGLADHINFFSQVFPKALAIVKQLAESLYITIETIINAPLEVVWEKWTNPIDIVEWNAASADWHTTRATNDLKTGGIFNYRMEAKDGSSGFDFYGIYDNVETNQLIEYTFGDERNVKVIFSAENGISKIVEIFKAESINSPEMQKTGWQSILNNFKKHVEYAL